MAQVTLLHYKMQVKNDMEKKINELYRLYTGREMERKVYGIDTCANIFSVSLVMS